MISKTTRRGIFLGLSGLLSVVSLAAGIWLFWVSGAKQLIVVSAVMLILTFLTWHWWRGLTTTDHQ